MSILIKGGRIITAADDYTGDVFVDGERVTLIGESLDVQADRVIDAKGKYVLPAGVDVHTHMDTPFGGTVTADNFYDGTVSGAFGGVGTIVDFCLQQGGQSFRQALDGWHEKLATQKPVIDVGFHIAITDLKEHGTLADLAKLPDEGVTSYKLFMAYKGAVMVDDETLFKSMRVAADSGAVVMVHAENGDAIDVLVKDALAAGNTSPKYHALTRPPELEGEATSRAIQLARVAGSPLYVVHVSCTDSIGPIERARDAGWNVWGETCSQYLLIDYSYIDQPGFEGAKYVYTPPPREKHHLEALWEALRTDTLSAVSTDHAPVQLPRAEGRWAGTTSRRSRTARPASRSGSRSCTSSASAPAGSISTAWSSCGRRTPRSSSASTRARARSRSAATPTSSSSIPRRSTRCRSRRTTRAATTTSSRAPRSPACP